MDSAAHSDPTLPDLLAARARSASDLRLSLDVGLGLLAGVAAVWWRPAGWVVGLSAALCFAAFGVWGLADRVLRARTDVLELIVSPSSVLDGALELLRGLAVVVGTAAAVALGFSLLGLLMGRFIS